MRYVLYILSFVFVLSCTERSSNNGDSLQTLAVDFIHVEGVNLLCDSMIHSSKIVAGFGDYLITKKFSDYFFTVYKLGENGEDIRELGEFGRRGNGPQEFFGIPVLYYKQDDNLLYVFDIQGGNNVNAYM